MLDFQQRTGQASPLHQDRLPARSLRSRSLKRYSIKRENRSKKEKENGLLVGWLIESIDSPKRSHKQDRPPLFLQIGTGQWCGAEYATLFPLKRTAIIYAREFGLLIDRKVRIVPHHG